MKVLIVYPYFGTPKGSWSTRMYELSRRWISKDAEVEIITAPYEKSDIEVSQFIESQIVDGINLTVINSGDNNRNTLYQRGIKSLLFSATASLLVLTRRYDVLLVSSGPITVGIPMLFAKFLRRKKTVFEVRDLWPEGAIQMNKINSLSLITMARRFEKLCYQKADAIVAASPGMKDGVLKVLDAKDKVFVYPNAADIELFQIPKTKPSSFIEDLEGKSIIIYAGSLGEMDECETAIRAMKHFRNDNLAMVFIGDGVEKTMLEKLARKTNENIHFTGLIPKTEVVKWYSVADASLVGFKDYPVLSTSSPNKMFDSFAAGVPVIQNTSGWIEEMIDTDGGGYNVDYESVESYIDVFNNILNDEAALNLKGRQAYDLAITRFNRDTIAAEYFELLSSLL